MREEHYLGHGAADAGEFFDAMPCQRQRRRGQCFGLPLEVEEWMPMDSPRWARVMFWRCP